jgi:hypothetical protein
MHDGHYSTQVLSVRHQWSASDHGRVGAMGAATRPNRAQMALRTVKTGSVSRGNVRLKVGKRSGKAGDASLGKQTLCQLSYSRSVARSVQRLSEREGHSSGHRRLPQHSFSMPQRSYSG